MSKEVVTGLNVLKKGQDPPLRPDDQLPDWLWQLAGTDIARCCPPKLVCTLKMCAIAARQTGMEGILRCSMFSASAGSCLTLHHRTLQSQRRR